MEYRTTRCASAGHPEFVLRYNGVSAFEDAVEPLLNYVEDSVASGVEFKPGQTLEFGWMWNQVKARPDGLLGLEEPDFLSFPIKWVEQIDRTVTHLRIQMFVAESVGLSEEIDFPPIVHSGLVCTQYERAGGFVLDRSEAEGNDSGWFVGCVDSSHDHNAPSNLRRVSLYDIALRRPEVVEFLALPAGSFVVRSDADLEIKRHGEPLNLVTGSYLHEKLRRAGV